MDAASVAAFQATALTIWDSGSDFISADAHISVRQPQEGHCVNGWDRGGGFYCGLRGDEGAEWKAAADSAFVAGGYHRGDAFAHLDICDGKVVFNGPGVLGDPFNDYLRSLPAEELLWHVQLYINGVDAEALMDKAFIRSVQDRMANARAGDEAARDQLRAHLRERNTQKASRHAGFVADEIIARCRKGAYAVWGTVEECIAAGRVPWVVGRVTVEEGKPRCCIWTEDVNNATAHQPMTLEGLSHIRAMCAEGKKLVRSSDDLSGYSNILFSLKSSCYFGFVFCGIVFSCRALEFGWRGAAATYQRAGLLICGFYRHVYDANLSLYIDDVFQSFVWQEDRADGGLEVARSRGYAHDVLRHGHFGIWKSNKKIQPIGQKVLALGFWIYGVRQCCQAPEEKVRKFESRVDELIMLVESGRFQDALGAKVAGTGLAFSVVCPMVRGELNVLYSVLHGRELRGMEAGVSAWWMYHFRGTATRRISPLLVQPLLDELRRLKSLVGARREYPFRVQRHRSRIVFHNDATLTQAGVKIWRVDADGSLVPLAEWGATLPIMVDEDRRLSIASEQMGCAEHMALLQTVRAVAHIPELREEFSNSAVDCYLDNDEVRLLMETGRIGGLTTLVKVEIRTQINLLWAEMGVACYYHRVASKDNAGDRPSRAREFTELRIRTDVALLIGSWASRRCTIDFFGSSACRVRMIEGEGPLPFVSRSPDGSCIGVNALAHDCSRQPGGGGEEAFGYFNPPFSMCAVLCDHLLECKARGVWVIPVQSEPFTLWRARLAHHTVKLRPLGTCYAERREQRGWVAVESPNAEVVEFDFSNSK